MEKYKSNDKVITPNGLAIVIGEMGADMAGCVLVRHNRKDANEFKPERAVKTFSQTGKSGWAAAYRLDDCQPYQGLGI